MDVSLKALLSCHSVYSWKIATEGQNPTVVLRLRPETQQSVCQSSVNTVAFKRKPPSQINRDRRRAEEYKHRRDHITNMTVPDSRCANRSEQTVESGVEKETIDREPNENQDKKGDSDSPNTSQSSVSESNERVARGGDAAKETAPRDESGGHETQSKMETNSETDSDTESENESDTEIKVTETENEQYMDIARALVKDAKRFRIQPDILKQEDRNNRFVKVVADWRCREAPKLLCISHDVIAHCHVEDETTHFQLRDPSDINLNFWHNWQEVDRGGYHKDMIENTRIMMEKVFNRVRQMM